MKLILARIAVVCLLILLVTGLFRGRALQAAYPHFEQYLPLIGLSLLLTALIAIIAYWRHHSPSKIDNKYIKRAIVALGLVSAVFIYLGKYSVVTAIERIHLLKFGMLGFFMFHAINSDHSRRYRFLSACIVAGAIGCIDETVQYLIPSRVFDWKDMRLNVISALLGAILAINTSHFERPFANKV